LISSKNIKNFFKLTITLAERISTEPEIIKSEIPQKLQKGKCQLNFHRSILPFYFTRQKTAFLPRLIAHEIIFF